MLLIPIVGLHQRPIGVLRLLSATKGAFDSFEVHSINHIRTIAALGLGTVVHNSTASFSRRDRMENMMLEGGGGGSANRPLHRVCRALQARISSGK